MKHFLLAATALLHSVTFAQQTTNTIDIGGQSRTYIQYLPVGFDVVTESLPVVFILHGLGDNAANMAGVGTNNIADTARFIAIYPQGKPNQLGQNAWNNGTLLASTANDIGFIDRVLDELINFKNVDPSRVYVTGFSMGGIMSYHLACNLNDRIAAIASMSGTMSTDDIASCVPAYKTPVMHLHGTNDGTVPYDSGALPTLSLVPETMAFWEGVHGCTSNPDSTQLPNTANDGITVDRFVWTGCTTNGALEHWRLNGADHVYLYQPVNDITEANDIWRFFRKWQHPNPAAASIDENATAIQLSVFPNPTKESVTISVNTKTEISIVDVDGKMCLNREVIPGETVIDISSLNAGIYLVETSYGATQRLVVE